MYFLQGPHHVAQKSISVNLPEAVSGTLDSHLPTSSLGACWFSTDFAHSFFPLFDSCANAKCAFSKSSNSTVRFFISKFSDLAVVAKILQIILFASPIGNNFNESFQEHFTL